ncbi:protein of unknown function [Candidatus Filomicrobium marinum]|uniref:Uncharacterized protein n=1 Tax=Candidatus Filomicrobium marinum TaxID=1608628 RepID=A0A0D6JF82_9HYPH|nr:protein of unknown function [Candidatus Filomicrobium marinum]CPR19021.1 protein of unknown function [Candidatus Filomicrobium marinum]
MTCRGAPIRYYLASKYRYVHFISVTYASRAAERGEVFIGVAKTPAH